MEETENECTTTTKDYAIFQIDSENSPIQTLLVVAESSWVVQNDPCGAILSFAVTDDDSIAGLTSVDDLSALD